MFLSLFRPALVTVAAVVTVGLTGGAAAAADLSLRDAAGDVWEDTMSPDGYVATTDTANVDVLATTFRHAARKIVVKASFSDLSRTGEGNMFAFRGRTNEGVRRVALLDAGPGHWGGKLSMYRPSGEPVGCRGMSRDIDYALNKVTITVPRACFSRPRWVEFTAMNATMTSDGRWLQDNPHNTQAEYNGWTSRVRRG